jgi:hypothetical protein
LIGFPSGWIDFCLAEYEEEKKLGGQGKRKRVGIFASLGFTKICSDLPAV